MIPHFKIAVLPGDGIGLDVTREADVVLLGAMGLPSVRWSDVKEMI